MWTTIMLNRKKIGIVFAIIVIILLIILLVNILNNKSDIELSTKSSMNLGVINYISTKNGEKKNISAEIEKPKKAGDVLITDSKLTYSNDVSKLTAKITNSQYSKDNLKLNIKFIANDGSVIDKIDANIGSVSSSGVKYITTNINSDVSNARDIIYEIVK